MDATFKNTLVGSPILRVEDLRFLRGRGLYVDDIELEGLLHGAVLRSGVAHGHIRNIDTSAALAMPGIHAVFTSADIGEQVPHIPLRRPMAGVDRFQQPVIATGTVRYVGEPIAFIVADTPSMAEDALELIEVEIEQLPVSMEADDGETAKTALFDGPTSNRVTRFTAEKGDVAAAFEVASYTRRERLSVQRHTALPMETRGLMSHWDADANVMTLYGAAKIPFFNRRTLAVMLDLPQEQVHYIENDVGGGFGVRGEFYPEDFLVAFATRRLNRPVKWIEDRREHFLAINHAREMACDIEVACREDGKILALRGEVHINVGAYVRPNGMTPPRNVAQFMSGPYAIPNIRLDALPFVSNKTPAGTYRAPGRFEGSFFIERMLDLVAADLGIDRVAIRRLNLIPTAEMPYPFADVAPTDAYSKTECDSGDYLTTLDRCLEEFRWDEKAALSGTVIDGRHHGVGLGCFVEGGSSGPRENARITLQADGRIAVAVGSSAIGQGLETVMTQIAADTLGLPMEAITLLHGSTTLLDEGFGSYHSRATVMGGSAVQNTAQNFIEAVRAEAAKRFRCPIESTHYSSGQVEGPQGAILSLRDFANAGLVVDGTFANQNKQTYAYGSAAAHVAVDPKTGHIDLLDYIVVEDVGRIINPLTMHGQVIGAAMQGLGGTLGEHLIYDADGQLLVGTLADYIVPTATDFPNVRAVTLEMFPSPTNPLGAKGAGEGGIISVGGVIANAVGAALASLNVTPRDLPLTPPAIWKLIRDARPV